MAENKTRIVIWILVGSCILNLIFAINAGQKRRVAVSQSEGLDAKLDEIGLRYKNAIQSYDALQKSLEEAAKDLKEQQRFNETLREALQEEQKRSQALREELEKTKSLLSLSSAASPKKKERQSVKPAPKPQEKKTDRTTKKW